MNCPWCEREMQVGELVGDGRTNVRFQQLEKKLTFGDKLSGVGLLTATQTRWAMFHLPAQYCPYCHKMVIETEVSQ